MKSTTYLALLRGVNVGGKSILSMPLLRETMAKSGFGNVRTYIQSGNIIFESKDKDTLKIAEQIKLVIQKEFKLNVDVVVYSKYEWKSIVDAAPKSWGKDPEW